MIEDIQGYDLIVIGGGAAGLMAAGVAARDGKRVILLEKMEKTGRKVRISGKGRGNITNARPSEEFCTKIRSGAEFFQPAFAELNNHRTIRFFERIGVRMTIEQGNRVFPKSGKAWDVAQALVDWCRDKGVEVVCDCRVEHITTLGGKVRGVQFRNARGFIRKVEAPAVIPICLQPEKRSASNSSAFSTITVFSQSSRQTSYNLRVLELSLPPMTIMPSHCAASSAAEDCLREVALHIVSNISQFV